MKLVAAVFVYKLQHPNYKVTCRVAIDRTTSVGRTMLVVMYY